MGRWPPYVWTDGNQSTGISVTTFVSEAATHLGVTRLSLVPGFSGRVRLRFTLRPWPSFPHRLALGKLTLPALKQVIASTYHLPPPSATLLLSQVLRPATPTAANREAIWYPGEVVITDNGASDTQRLLWIRGHASHGDEVAETAAIAVARELGDVRVSAENSPQIVRLTVEGTVEKGKTYAFTKFVAASGGHWGAPEENLKIVTAARTAGFETALNRHQGRWHDLWQSDIRVEGDPGLQRSIHSDLFYMLENSSEGTAWPMAANGFSPNYLDHVFWDNDSWDFPVMLLLHPERAKSQLLFRSRTLPAALKRARVHGFEGAMYPWEADPLEGTEQTPYFARENAEGEIHINGDVAIAQWQYYLATGDRDWLRQYGYPVIRATADFWASRVTLRPAAARDNEKGRYELLGVTSPDEAYTHVDNDSFTNAIARRNLEIAVAAASVLGETPRPQWSTIARSFYVPFSQTEQRHLDFDPNVPHNKQTWMGSALTLLAYPQLDLPMSPRVRANDFAFAVHSMKELTPDANAMILAMVSIEATELGDADTASKWLHTQQAGFLKPPFNVRSETALNNTTYILATSSGFLQNFLYGFPGLRITDEGLQPRYPAVLPAAWKALTLKNIAFRGRRFDYIIRRDSKGNVEAAQQPPQPAD